MAPLELALEFHSLPPILHKHAQTPVQSYSKGARGLSVLLRVMGIFTHTTNSLSLSSRQRSTRYAIHAGRNLPDKVFRYLRTVIVTAAVYRGFNSELALLLLTFRHRAGVSPYTSSSEFAEACVFVKQSPPPGLCHLLLVAQREVLLIPKLRRQIAEFLQHSSLKRLGMLYQSTCVGFGYGLYGGYFLELLRCPINPVRSNNTRNSSPPVGPRMLTWFPSTTPFGLALGTG